MSGCWERQINQSGLLKIKIGIYMNEELNKLLTVIIPVKNEETNLPQCLEGIKGLLNVVIVDSGSTDATCKIAADYGREVVQFTWNGMFPKKRNWILRNYKFKTPWVMFLDADERPDAKFWEELARTLPNTKHDVFIIYLNNWFLGRLLRHGDTPRKTAIVRLGRAEYERIEEQGWSKLDMEIHEHLVTDGTVGRIKTPIAHYDKRSLSSYYVKHNEYSDWESRRYLALKDYKTGLTFRQRVKYRMFMSKLLPLGYFAYTYIFKLGFLDGAPGYYFAVNKFNQFTQLQAKVYEQLHVSS